MSFIKLENLNDFIQPGSTCVKPIEKKIGVVAKVNDINLSDCLACSGCITTAETVLVQQQNHEELFKAINEAKSTKTNRLIAVSLSPQSISSLAYKYHLTAQETAERLASFFMSIGCHEVYDINLARHLALIESYNEFMHDRSLRSNGPIFSSVCPGWVCYTEKTNGELVIPHLSKVRSPQQIMGTLLKRLHQIKSAKNRGDVYHVTLMPCFDKKLEASRQDFKYDDIPDVDCVLTPIELQDILDDEGVGLLDFEPRRLDVMFDEIPELSVPLTSHFGTESGGYAENILLAELSEKLDCDEMEKLRLEIEYTITKNSDFIEVFWKTKSAKSEATKDMGKYAIVNGFRNIQTLVQRLKRKSLKYDYIEVMACPSGCINGGAQCKPNFGHDQSSAINNSKKIYDEIPKVPLRPSKSSSILETISQKLDISLDQLHELLRTEFHAVPKIQNLTVNW